MGRLAAFYHWDDQQCLDQAIAVPKSQSIDFEIIKGWSKREGHETNFRQFLDRLKNS